MVRNAFRALLAALSVLLGVSGATLSAESTAPVSVGHSHDPVLKWNAIALQAVVEDHSGTFGAPENGGPTRAARALAIVHIAIFDAVNAIVGGYEPYVEVTGFSEEFRSAASVQAAVAQAAHNTLVFLYPKQQAVFDAELKKALHGITAKSGRDEGLAIGAAAAANILLARLADGGDAPDVPFPPSETKQIGLHQPDPLNPGQGLHVPAWGQVLPFAMGNVADFQAVPPPQPDSSDALERAAYALAFDEVKRLGGDGVITPTERTAEQTDIGLFWGYDGSIGVGVPPRIYNQIVRIIAMHEHHTPIQSARLFALINIAMADAGIASWYTKYTYNYWRPVVAVRCGGSGAIEDADGNEFTTGDANWTPLGAPASNRSNGGIDFTPPFPAYTSGHATFGAAVFRTLAHLYGDDYSFRLISDELNGRNTDSNGVHRRAIMRTFESFSQAARENADSRIYLGVHWRFDADAGIAVGNAIADHAFANLLQPVP